MKKGEKHAMDAKYTNEIKKELEEARKTFSEAKKHLSDINGEVSGYVKQYPWPAFFAAAAVGAGVAMVGIKRLAELAVENRALINDVLTKEFGVDLERGIDIANKAKSAVMSSASAIGA